MNNSPINRLRIYSCLLALSFLTIHCQNPIRTEYLIGKWKTDSIIIYYNGFETREKAGQFESVFTYQNQQIVRESRGDDFREFQYHFTPPDSLTYISPEGNILGAYQILQLSVDQLVLRKEKEVIFSGEGQERYEIRIFSKLSESE